MEQELQASEKKYAELLSQHKRLKEEHENTVVCVFYLFFYSIFIHKLLNWENACAKKLCN